MRGCMVYLRELLALFAVAAVCSSAQCLPEENSSGAIKKVSATAEVLPLPVQVDPVSRNFLAPSRSDFLKPDQAGLEYEEVYFSNQHGERLRAWLLPAEDAQQTIVFCMGNTGNISAMLMYASILRQGGFEVLLFDYQGYGGSSGIATAISLLGDTLSAFDYVRDVRHRDPQDIGLFGVSLGSVLALTVAAEREAGAVAVEDIFLPVKLATEMKRFLPDDMATQLGAAAILNLVLPRVDPLKTVPRLKCPLFLMHGEHDRLLPPTATIQVSEISDVPTRVWIMQGCGHAPETLEVNDREYAAQLQRFFREAFAGSMADPQIEYATQADADSHVSRITVRTEFPRDVQIAVGSPDGRFLFARPRVDGTRTFEVLTPFAPTHLSAIAFEYTEQITLDEWIPDVSELSRCLAEFKDLVQEMSLSCPLSHSPPDENGVRRWVRKPEDWHWLCERLPSAENVHPRIRPRYAKLIASVAMMIAASELEPGSLITEAVLSYLPDETQQYYELHNAGFQLGFRDHNVCECLWHLSRHKAAQQDLNTAKHLLKMGTRMLPPHLFGIWPAVEQIDAAESAEDLEALIPEVTGSRSRPKKQ